MRLSVVTWNVHHCVGTDGNYAPERAAEVIRAFDADIVCLQELDHRYPPVLGRPQAEYFEHKTGMTAIFGPAIDTARGAHGNAVLTRLPITRETLHDISAPGREARTVVDVTLDAGGPTVRALTTHLGLKATERRTQARRLAGIAGDSEADATIVAGDMNVWMPGDPALAPLDRELGRARRPRTFPARWPVFALDRIWVSPTTAGAKIEALNDPEVRAASDHLPVKAVITLP